jgi:glycosyltransferase involved in cell wall biosynthesis
MESIFSQDYPGKMELIVVDQSKQHNEEVRKFLRDHRDDFRYIFQSRPNAPMARNTAFSAARNELILFIDDDVVPPPDALSRLARHFRPFRLQALACLVVSQSNPEASLRGYARQCGIDMIGQTELKRVGELISALILLPAEAVRAVGGFDSLIGDLTPTAASDDYDFCHRLRLAKIPLFIDPTVRALHKDIPGGCAVRWTDPQLARKYQMKASAYMSIKYDGGMGLRGWTRLCRGHVLNRETLPRGLRYVRGRLLEARNAVREVESFIAANEGEALPLKTPR